MLYLKDSVYPRLRQGGFPMHLLPAVVHGPCPVGRIASTWCAVPQGTTVNVALGDLQCSVSGLQPEIGDAGIGTCLDNVYLSFFPSQY